MIRFERPAPFASWGRAERVEARAAYPRFAGDLPEILCAPDRPPSVLPVGLGRSSGDACLNSQGGLIAMSGLDRCNTIDKRGLILRAQAGLSLGEALKLLVPQGLFLPVLPGTRHVTLGGAVANDVHGKNHPIAGSFGRWIRRIGLNRSDAGAVQLAPGDKDGLFAATIGGLGLTGIISWVEIDLVAIESTDLEVEHIAFSTFDEYYQLVLEHSRAHYRTAWIDCGSPGRGVFSHATHVKDGDLEIETGQARFDVPFDTPGPILNGMAIAAFNALYATAKATRREPHRIHHSRFHFPLDAIGHWNRLYGANGFRQYQCVLPHAKARDAAMEILRTVRRAGGGSTLGVLKEFGSLASPGLISFPMPGATLAIDVRNRGERTLALLDTLDAIVLSAGGRIYPAMDGRASPKTFQTMYPHWRKIEALRDPAIRSDFWTRVSAPA
jgi:L-gulonolactone oxidase